MVWIDFEQNCTARDVRIKPSFRSREERHVVIEDRRRHANHELPHSSLKDLTTIKFKTRYGSMNPVAIIEWLQIRRCLLHNDF